MICIASPLRGLRPPLAAILVVEKWPKPIREISLLHDKCDLFIGVSSGVSVVTSTIYNKLVPRIQYCRDYWCSTFPVSIAPMELVTDNRSDNMRRKADGKMEKVKVVKDDIQDEFYHRLKELINKIKSNSL